MDNLETTFPSIIFRVKESLYSVNSQYLSTIMRLPPFEKSPDSPPCVTGIFLHRGTVVQMLDLRLLFRKKTLEQEYLDFCDMIDARKQDHIRWVDELIRCVKADEPFSLATDPHKCAFGRWYDSFQTDNDAVHYQLKKIEEPHRQLHEAAIQTMQCSQQCASCTRTECLKSVLTQAKLELMPQILQLLDDTKGVFHANVYHEMVLILNGESGLGLVVDEVLAVEELDTLGNSYELLRNSPHLCAIRKSPKFPQAILELDIPKLLGTTEQLAIPS